MGREDNEEYIDRFWLEAQYVPMRKQCLEVRFPPSFVCALTSGEEII
jgi:hypothetical protein